MSSKMIAGLLAGGFGAALSVALVLSSLSFPVFASYLALALLFGLGVLSGALAARRLDLADYGHQSSAGAFAGLVAAGVTEVCDLILRLIFAVIGKASPTSVLSTLILSRLPISTEVALILLMVIVNLLLYLIYLLIVVGISSLAAEVFGRAKTPQALKALLEAQGLSDLPGAVDPLEEPPDPALLPFMRPEYSPFVPDEPPPPLSPWQQRRLERERTLATQDSPLAEKSHAFGSQRSPVVGSQRSPGISQPGLRANRNNLPADKRGLPAAGQGRADRPGLSGPMDRGAMPGSAQRGSTSGVRPPSNAQWPRPRRKD
jgi:hypothetical protein